MASKQQTMVTMLHERENDAEENEWFGTRVPVEERSETMRYLMRRATWCIGVAACGGILAGVVSGCMMAAGFR